MKNKIKIYFTDFWPNFEIDNNIFVNFLNNFYEIEICKDNPDYLFYSVFGIDFHKYKCTRIFFTGENKRPNFRECDFAFSFDYTPDNPRNYRLPQYYQYGNPYDLVKKKKIEEILQEKTKFCNFIYSNPNCKKRNEFFKKLNKYKKVDSAGRYMNNIGKYLGSKAEDKWEFLKPYKFTIAFENEEADYYTSEKIFEAMKVNSIPIFWGNPKIGLDFNTKSFLNYYDFDNDDALIEKIIETDNNDKLYIEYLKQPYFENNRVNEFVRSENILKQFEQIFSRNYIPVANSSKYLSNNYLVRKMYHFILVFRYESKKIFNKLRNFTPAKLKIKFDLLRK